MTVHPAGGLPVAPPSDPTSVATDLAAPNGRPGSAHAHAHGDGTCLHLDPATRSDATKRLKSVRGHVEGVLRMLDDPGVYCVDVLKQVSAVQGALRKVSEGVLRAHVRDHVATAAQRGDTEHIVDELMEALKYRA
jgi:CsoR family transcriptional regulator, copper-sensing transcriptional repressor